jgi:hypothetical protein
LMADITEGVRAVIFYLSLPDPLPKAGAVALVSVLYRESRLKPGSQGNQASEHGGVLNPTGAYGIASWNGPRQQALKDFCDKHIPVLAYGALDSQLLFVLTEMANSYQKTWAAVRNPALSYGEIIAAIVREYENPKEPEPEIADAIAYARELWVPAIEATPTLPKPPPPPVIVMKPDVAIGTAEPGQPTLVPIGRLHEPDHELALIETLVESLRGLNPAAQKRVLTYLYSRMVS